MQWGGRVRLGDTQALPEIVFTRARKLGSLTDRKILALEKQEGERKPDFRLAQSDVGQFQSHMQRQPFYVKRLAAWPCTFWGEPVF